MDDNFLQNQAKLLRKRVTELRMRKGVSESQMSLDLGKSRGYIRGITSGEKLPSFNIFLEICEYFEIYPEEFFSQQLPSPLLTRKTMEELEALSDENLLLILNLVKKLQISQQHSEKD